MSTALLLLTTTLAINGLLLLAGLLCAVTFVDRGFEGDQLNPFNGNAALAAPVRGMSFARTERRDAVRGDRRFFRSAA